MRSLVLIVSSFALTILGWGLYVPMLRWGQVAMSDVAAPARWRPFVCVGLAYFLIGVIVPTVLLNLKGEKGQWSASGILWSLIGGALGAMGALGIILAINFGAQPIFVAPLVFGTAPVVNSFLTIYLAGKMREIGPMFLAGLVMVLLGSVTVLTCAPHKPPAATAQAAPAVDTAAGGAAPAAAASARRPVTKAAANLALQVLSIALVALCWGSYGPTLHKGQAAMHHSRLRPLLCVGLAYFAIAVVAPHVVLAASPEASRYTFSGTMWSLLAGAAGAIGALGIIMAFNFGGKPVYVMPLVFGGAPVVATLVTTSSDGLLGQLGSLFLAGLILTIAGAAMVLVFAPRSAGPPVVSPAPAPPPVEEKPEPAVSPETPPAATP